MLQGIGEWRDRRISDHPDSRLKNRVNRKGRNGRQLYSLAISLVVSFMHAAPSSSPLIALRRCTPLSAHPCTLLAPDSCCHMRCGLSPNRRIVPFNLAGSGGRRDIGPSLPCRPDVGRLLASRVFRPPLCRCPSTHPPSPPRRTASYDPSSPPACIHRVSTSIRCPPGHRIPPIASCFCLLAGLGLTDPNWPTPPRLCFTTTTPPCSPPSKNNILLLPSP